MQFTVSTYSLTSVGSKRGTRHEAWGTRTLLWRCMLPPNPVGGKPGVLLCCRGSIRLRALFILCCSTHSLHSCSPRCTSPARPAWPMLIVKPYPVHSCPNRTFLVALQWYWALQRRKGVLQTVWTLRIGIQLRATSVKHRKAHVLWHIRIEVLQDHRAGCSQGHCAGRMSVSLQTLVARARPHGGCATDQ